MMSILSYFSKRRNNKDDDEDEQLPKRANLSENSSDSSDNEIFPPSSPSN